MNRALWLIVLAACRGHQSSCADALHHFEDHILELRALDGKPMSRSKDKATAHAFIDVLVKRCTEDEWPDDAIRCVKNASSAGEFEKCVDRLSELQRKKLGSGIGAPAERSRSKADIAQLTVKKYSFEAYPQWAASHPDKACPNGLAEFNAFMDTSDTKDPWGNPYRLFCGANLPAGAHGIAVMSLGEDGREGTDDDIKSW